MADNKNRNRKKDEGGGGILNARALSGLLKPFIGDLAKIVETFIPEGSFIRSRGFSSVTGYLENLLETSAIGKSFLGSVGLDLVADFSRQLDGHISANEGKKGGKTTTASATQTADPADIGLQMRQRVIAGIQGLSAQKNGALNNPPNVDAIVALQIREIEAYERRAEARKAELEQKAAQEKLAAEQKAAEAKVKSKAAWQEFKQETMKTFDTASDQLQKGTDAIRARREKLERAQKIRKMTIYGILFVGIPLFFMCKAWGTGNVFFWLGCATGLIMLLAVLYVVVYFVSQSRNQAQPNNSAGGGQPPTTPPTNQNP